MINFKRVCSYMHGRICGVCVCVCVGVGARVVCVRTVFVHVCVCVCVCVLHVCVCVCVCYCVGKTNTAGAQTRCVKQLARSLASHADLLRAKRARMEDIHSSTDRSARI